MANQLPKKSMYILATALMYILATVLLIVSTLEYAFSVWAFAIERDQLGHGPLGAIMPLGRIHLENPWIFPILILSLLFTLFSIYKKNITLALSICILTSIPLLYIAILICTTIFKHAEY